MSLNEQVKRNKDGVEWRPVPGWPGYYATALGDIGSEWRPTKAGTRRGFSVKTLRQRVNNHGYVMVKLGQRQVAVHVLVAAAFLGPRPAELQTCHNDGDKLNNRVENLRYDTALANNRDKIRHGTSTPGSLNNTAKLTEDDVALIRTADALVGNELSGVELAARFGVSPSAISLIRLGKTWHHVKGFA